MHRRLAGLAAACAALLALPAVAQAAPTPVTAWYMYGTTPSGLASAAYNHGCYFGAHHPAGYRLMMLDFGAARKIDSNTWGALDFSSVRMANGDILDAMKAAANGHHNCYNGTGSTVVAYGNNNWKMSPAANGNMTWNDVYYAGYYQSYRAQQLSNYQAAQGYNVQNAAAGSDMELDWDGNGITKQLVNGAYAHGFALYYDYGDAAGCPQSGSGGACNNGWTVGDVAYKSYHGSAVPMPEIYYTANADQWTVVRRNWNANHTSSYTFWGSTGETPTQSGHLTAAQGWNALVARNPGMVLSDLICFC
jgi:hypothetical protein